MSLYSIHGFHICDRYISLYQRLLLVSVHAHIRTHTQRSSIWTKCDRYTRSKLLPRYCYSCRHIWTYMGARIPMQQILWIEFLLSSYTKRFCVFSRSHSRRSQYVLYSLYFVVYFFLSLLLNILIRMLQICLGTLTIFSYLAVYVHQRKCVHLTGWQKERSIRDIIIIISHTSIRTVEISSNERILRQ